MRSRARGANGGRFGAVIRGIAISAIVYLGIMLILAFIMDGNDDPSSLVGAFGLVGILIGGIVGGFASTKLGGSLAVGAAVALIMSLTMLLVGIIICGGAPELRCLINCLCYFGIFMLGAFAATKIGGGSGKRHRR